MIDIGRGIRIKRDFLQEVEVSKKYGFKFMQIWYINGELKMPNINSNRIEFLNNLDLPVIVHALFEISDFEEYGVDLLETIEALNLNEVIVHPVFSKDKELRFSPDITATYRLLEAVHRFGRKAKKLGIKVYIENNSLRENFNHSTEQIKQLFERDDYVDFVLDIAHVDSMEHIRELVAIKKPTCLQISDKKFDDNSEHLQIGKGDIDFDELFNDILKGYEGKVILEVEGTDEEIYEAKQRLEAFIK